MVSNTRRASERRAAARDHILENAVALFSTGGFHATGVDRVAERAGVSKKTLYHHFRTKDELVLAALARYDGTFRNAFMRDVERETRDPRGRLLAVFDVAARWFEADGFAGCPFLNAVGEHATEVDALGSACRAFKERLRNFLARLSREAGAAEPDRLAEELALLLEGATATAQARSDPSAARVARRIAERLLVAEGLVSARAAAPDADGPGVADASRP